MRSALIFTSLSGNTEATAKVVAHVIHGQGGVCHLWQAGRVSSSLSPYDLVIWGSYTWGDGELPRVMRQELRRVLVERQEHLQAAAVFGTGDTQFPYFCRAAEEMHYHLMKAEVPMLAPALKIEQACVGRERVRTREWTMSLWEGWRQWSGSSSCNQRHQSVQQSY